MGIKTVVQQIKEMRMFWATICGALLQKQPGMSWNDVQSMDVQAFFPALEMIQKRSKEQSK